MQPIVPQEGMATGVSCTPVLIVLMGVAGSGKSSVGERLANQLGCPFIEGDRFHPDANIERMRSGLPMQTAHRMPWIANIVDEVNRIGRRDAEHRHGFPWLAVLSCSALSYEIRERLRIDVVGMHCRFVHLFGDIGLIRCRLAAREGHFFAAELLESQFEALQVPDRSEAIPISIDRPLDAVVEAIMDTLSSYRCTCEVVQGRCA